MTARAEGIIPRCGLIGGGFMGGGRPWWTPGIAAHLDLVNDRAFIRGSGVQPASSLGTFTRATGKTFANAAGVVSTAGNGVLARDHIYEGSVWKPLGMSVDEGRTQRMNLTETPSDWTATASGVDQTMLSDTLTAPDGDADAELWSFDLTGGTEARWRASIPCAGSTLYWLSCWFYRPSGAPGQLKLPRMRITGNVSGAIVGGAQYLDLAGNNLDLSALPEDTWVRGYRSFTTGASDTSLTVQPIEVQDEQDGDKTDVRFGAWGAQVEAGLRPGPYIPNTASSGTVSRSADVWDIPITVFPIVATGPFTIRARYRTRGGNPGSGTNFHVYAFGGALADTFRVQTRVSVAAATQAQVDTTGYSSQALHALGINVGLTDYTVLQRVAQDNFGAIRAGGSLQTDTSGNVPTLTYLRVGYSANGGQYLQGWLKSLEIWDRALANAEMTRYAI